MPPAGPPNDFTPSVRRMIAAKARRLVGQYGLRPQDRPDIEQELAARVTDRLAAFRPDRGTLETFVAMVIEQAAANLRRERRAGKRTPPRGTPPPAPAEDVPDPRAKDDARRRDLAHDVAAILERLPPELRAVADALMDTTMSELSRRSGIPRTTLYGRQNDLRAAFDRAGLRDYL